MHQTMKKAWAILLTLCLLLGALPIGAQAAVLKGEDYITQQLSLGEDLVLHLRASLPDGYDDLAETATGTVTYAGKTDTYTIGDLTPDENGMYDLPVEMAVAEMTENINLVVNGKYMGLPIEAINENYTIRDYLVAIIDGDYSQTTKDLCLELLNMGAWAQLYFNHNISDLANAGYSTSAANAVPEESPVVNVEGAVDGITFYGTSVRFLSQTAVRFYFAADGAVDGYTFTIDGTEYEPVAKDGYYYIETPGINPQDMSKEITASVSDGTNTINAYYAPIWYFIRTYNKTENEYNKGLMEAAYSYYKTAETYTTKICMDVEITTLGNSTEDIDLGFYPLDFEGSIHEECPERVSVKAGTTTTVKLDQGKFLVDGEFPGIGVVVFGGPEWNTTLEDGSNDKHAFTISNMRLEGPEDRAIDLRNATVTTGFGGSNTGGTATMANSTLTVTNGIRYDGHMITFNEVDTYLALDMEITTLSNSTDAIEVGFYPYGFDDTYSDGYTDKLTLTAGTTNTVYLDASKYLVDGEIPGIGFVVFGGPEWNTQISDGVYDRHAINVSNVRLEGSVDQAIDMTNATVATGFAGSNSGGIAAVADGVVTVTGGFRYDGHMITFVGETEPEPTEPEPTEPESTEPPVAEPDTYLCLDMLFTTLGGSTDPVELGFYPYNFEGDINNHTDKIAVTAGTKTTVKLDAAKYMVDGELTGIGFAIFGGPAWDAKLPDGYTPDRHTVTISGVYLEGAQSTVYDLSKSVWAGGNNGTGFTNANGSGAATIGSEIVITNGFQYDGHKITLVEDTNTYVCMDLLLTTLGNSTDPVEVRFYAHNFEGNAHESYTDSVTVTAGTAANIKLNAANYLVDGEFSGIGVAIFGGPAWDAKLEDGYTPDRHTVTISNLRLEGAEEKIVDLSNATSVAGFGGTNSGGAAAVVDEEIVISNGFCYDGHMITFVGETEPETTEPEVTEPEETEPVETEPVETEPPVVEPDTYLCVDMLFTTLGGSTDPVELGFYPYNFEGDINNHTDKIAVTAGTKTTVKLDAAKYMVDGELTGIGFAIFGGPAWDAKLEDGYTPDRHTVTISGVYLEGAQSTVYDLSKSVWAGGNNGTGFTNANGSGAATIGSEIVITNGFQYDGHKISLVEDTNTYIAMDLLFTTLGNSTDPVEIGFFPSNFEGDINNWTDKITVTAGTTAAIKLNAEKYLVDGKVSGIGFAIFGGPAWDAKLPDGYTPDRHTVTISNARLEGYQSKAFDLSQSTWASAANAGYSNANGSGAATIGSEIVITNGFQYDGHKITLVEDTNTYLCLDLELTTLGGSTDPVNIRLFNYNYEGSVGDGYTDLVTVTAGTTTKIKVKVDNYLVDGELPGFGFAIFGGPEWNTQLEDGTYDRHSVVISNVRLEGVQEQSFNLNDATVANGTNGTGFTWANSGGVASIVDGELVITGGFCYDAYEITL